MNCVEKVARENVFFLSHHTSIRGHPMKFLSDQFRTDNISGTLLDTSNLWNLLPQAVVMATSRDDFKEDYIIS